MHVCMDVRGQHCCPSQWFSSIFFEMGLLLNLELTDLARPADQSAPGTPSLFCTYFGTRGTNAHYYICFVCVCWGSKLRFEQQTLNKNEPSPSPKFKNI